MRTAAFTIDRATLLAGVEVLYDVYADNHKTMNLPFPDMTALQSMLNILDDPRQLHAALVHAPIAVAALFPIAVLVLIGTGGKSQVLRWTAALGYLAAAVLGWYAAEVGQMAVVYEHAAEVRTTEALTVLEQHEAMGDWVPLILAAVGVTLILTAVPTKWVRIPMLALSLLASVAALGWVGVTAHYGGQLVYEHGFNTPTTANNAATTTAVPREVTTAPPPRDQR